MATFLFWMSPEPGHILPTLEVAQELVRRGHRTVYYVYGRVQKELAELGFETTVGFRDISSEVLDASVTRRTGSPLTVEARVQRQFETSGLYYDFLRNDLLRAIHEIAPDVLIADGIKDWRLSEGSPTFYRYLLKHIKVVRICVHLRNIYEWDFRWPEIPLVVLCPEEFELPELVDSRAIYAEASRFTRTTTIHRRYETHRSSPSIYMTFGSQFSEYQGAKDALREILTLSDIEPTWSFVLNIDNHDERLWSGHPNVSSARMSSHLSALKNASAIICHGGLGTIKDAISAQVPMIVIPQLWDQPLNGRRVEYHRLGVSMSGNRVDAHSLEYAVYEALSSKEIKDGLQLMHDIFEDKRGLKIAAAACEGVL